MRGQISTAISFAILVGVVGVAFSYVSAVPGPWFGFRGSPLTPALAEAADLGGQQGFLVMIVEPDSPAKNAGLQGGNRLVEIGGLPACLGGDLITGINGVQVTGIDEISDVLKTSKVGSSVSLTVVRGNNSPLDLRVILGEDPNSAVPDLQDVCK